MHFLANGVPGLAHLAADEIASLLGGSATVDHPGAVRFQADQIAPFTINEYARSVHRVLVLIEETTATSPAAVYDAAAGLPIDRYFEPGQSFGVRADRHGTHEFTSVDVAERIGQAFVDESRAAFGKRLPVDLDDPDVIVRAALRDDRLLIGLDATGERSLHRRHWRECEHNAPLRPTIAHAMLRAVEYEPTESLLDPMCGGGAIPIEAARFARGDPAGGVRETHATEQLSVLPDDGRERARERWNPTASTPEIVGIDKQDRWVRCATVNRDAADCSDMVEIRQGDATSVALDADVIAVDLPFGIRTTSDLRQLYADFSASLQDGDWDRFVAVTTRPEFLDVPGLETTDFRYGRLDANLVVAD